jgi:hypothetical protein
MFVHETANYIILPTIVLLTTLVELLHKLKWIIQIHSIDSAFPSYSDQRLFVRMNRFFN